MFNMPIARFTIAQSIFDPIMSTCKHLCLSVQPILLGVSILVPLLHATMATVTPFYMIMYISIYFQLKHAGLLNLLQACMSSILQIVMVPCYNPLLQDCRNYKMLHIITYSLVLLTILKQQWSLLMVTKLLQGGMCFLILCNMGRQYSLPPQCCPQNTHQLLYINEYCLMMTD